MAIVGTYIYIYIDIWLVPLCGSKGVVLDGFSILFVASPPFLASPLVYLPGWLHIRLSIVFVGVL